MSGKLKDESDLSAPRDRADRRVRADAQRNLDTLLETAKAVFATSGVDAPVREIAEKAGVGIGTVYRHFPQRADLIAAVFRHEIDACAEAAPNLAAKYTPREALAKWMQRYAAFIATKRGLAPALHSGNPAFGTLRAHFEQRVGTALRRLLESAVAAGEVRNDIDSDELLHAVASLCMPAQDDGRAQRMVALLVDGLRIQENSYVRYQNAVRTISEGLRQEAGDKLRVTLISPGFVHTDFAESMTNPEVKSQIVDARDKIAIAPDAIARAIAFAIEQPSDVDVGEIVVRPTAQG